MQPFGRNRYGPKIGGLCPFSGGKAGSPPNTMWPGPRPTCMPSFILIRQTVWPQYTNVTDRQTDRQDRQRTDSIGRTVLQTVAQKFREAKTCDFYAHRSWIIAYQLYQPTSNSRYQRPYFLTKPLIFPFHAAYFEISDLLVSVKCNRGFTVGIAPQLYSVTTRHTASRPTSTH